MREELLAERVVRCIEGTLPRQRAVTTKALIGKPGEIFFVKKIRLVAKRAGHPLPRQIIAGRVTIEQVLQKPACSRLPGHMAPMDEIGSQPHPGMIVQIPRGV